MDIVDGRDGAGGMKNPSTMALAASRACRDPSGSIRRHVRRLGGASVKTLILCGGKEHGHTPTASRCRSRP